MKRFFLIGLPASLALAFSLFFTTGCMNSSGGNSQAAADSTARAAQGAIVYFDFDRVAAEYDMANDLRSVVEAKVNSINQEVKRRGEKLERDQKAFQEKVNKGLMTQSTAEVQYRKLQEQQYEFQKYAEKKQREIAEEQQVMTNQIADAINTFILAFNEQYGYAMILTTQGDLLKAPVVVADPSLDITDDLIEGLNAEYVKTKGKNE
ncbi:MAG: OmpH family outer membrane protein [Bacteroidales bacterium]|nr:OmpH family outer membrane protein [Bacteroidales bacterium]